jgi:GH43 family beta-xylosidase
MPFTNPVITDEHGEDHGDPFVLRHGGEYFLYHTTDDGDRGISVHRSPDLVHWTFAGIALEPGGWAETDIWAPEVVHAGGELLMYVSATTLGPDGEGVEADRRQGLARARDPLGPFAWDPAPLVRDAWSIDGHPFRDWLFYNVRPDPANSGNVVDRLLAPDRLAGEPAPVVFPSQPWEADAAGERFWNEGAWVMERRGRLHQMYSGGFYREATYGIGTAWADDPRGPWTKDPANPIFASGERITGPGHHCVVLAPDGVTPYAVYHAYDGGRPGRKVHIDRLYWCGDRPAIGDGRPTERPQPLPPGPVHDRAVPHWHAAWWTADGGARTSGSGAPDAPAGATLTSHLDDPGVHPLPHAWDWGGSGPVEVALAVRGEARLGDAQVRSEDGRYALLRTLLPGGARTIRVAGEGEVTDFVATAR